MTGYDKLVRDRIPEIVRENDETPVTHVAEGEAYRERLREKLCEEAEDLDAAEIERLREEKADERGGFADGVVLERVE